MTRERPAHYLREWRKARGKTLEQVAEAVELLGATRLTSDPDSRPVGMTHATLSRIERGKLPYNQALLEILAEIYGTDPASLLWRNPESPEPIWSLWDTLTPVQRQQATAVIEAIKRNAA